MQAINELPLNRVIVGTQEDANAEGTRVGVDLGGHFTVNDLLHGLLMHSGNDAAHALAVAVGGMDVALQKINTLAAKLRARDAGRHPSPGLDGPGMSTSAYDMGLFYLYAFSNPTFATSSPPAPTTSPAIRQAWRDLRPSGLQVEERQQTAAELPGRHGRQDRFTDDARQTFVGAANRDGRRLVAILLRGTRDPSAVWSRPRTCSTTGSPPAPTPRSAPSSRARPSLIPPKPEAIGTVILAGTRCRCGSGWRWSAPSSFSV